MRCILTSSLLLTATLMSPAMAQSLSLGGPIAGHVFSRGSRTVRPLIGIPGATYIGAPVLENIDAAFFAPAGSWAFVVRSGRGTFFRDLSETAPAEGQIDKVDQVLWSRDGSVSVLYSSADNRLQRVRLTAGGLAAETPVDLSTWGKASTLAVDPSGRRIAFGVAGSGLYIVASGEAPVLLSSMTQPVAAAFDGDGRRLFAADLETQRILEFDNDSGPFEFAALSTDEQPLAPVGLAISTGSRFLLLADSKTQSVRVYDIASRSLANTISLDFQPTRFDALSADSSFLLNDDDAGQWLQVLDARTLPGVYFVPPAERRLYDPES